MKINETHLAVLRKQENGLLNVDYVELHFEDEDAMLELESMADNENRTVLDLENYINGSGLKTLIGSYNFCEHLDRPYQRIYKYQPTNREEYYRKLKDLREQISKTESGFLRKRLEDEIADYIKKRRRTVYEEIRKRRIAHILETAYKDCEEDARVLAFSHRKVGFTFPEFKLGEDFDVIYRSNFGYGASSYFFTNIRYKGIDILPYSDWIRYQIADKYDIIRYTRRHLLQNSSWIDTMHFTVDAYNHSVNSPSTFVEKWVINECKEMVEGLERLLGNTDEYVVLTSFFDQKNSYTLKGWELLDFKGERVSGALTFLEKIQELKEIYDNVDFFIRKIMSCNQLIYGQLETEIDEIEQKVEEALKDIEAVEPVWEDLKGRFNEYQREKNKIAEDVSKLTLDHLDKQSEIQTRFEGRFPEYISFKEKYNLVEKEYQSLQENLNRLNTWMAKFAHHVAIIKKHFDENGLQLQASA